MAAGSPARSRRAIGEARPLGHRVRPGFRAANLTRRAQDALRRFLVRAAFLAACERAVFDGRPTDREGTRLPSRRASDRPIAIACLRLFTLPPLPPLPLLSVPRLNLRISRSTSFDALGEYLLAISVPPCLGPRRYLWNASAARLLPAML